MLPLPGTADLFQEARIEIHRKLFDAGEQFVDVRVRWVDKEIVFARDNAARYAKDAACLRCKPLIANVRGFFGGRIFAPVVR